MVQLLNGANKKIILIINPCGSYVVELFFDA